MKKLSAVLIAVLMVSVLVACEDSSELQAFGENSRQKDQTEIQTEEQPEVNTANNQDNVSATGELVIEL